MLICFPFVSCARKLQWLKNPSVLKVVLVVLGKRKIDFYGSEQRLSSSPDLDPPSPRSRARRIPT